MSDSVNTNKPKISTAPSLQAWLETNGIGKEMREAAEKGDVANQSSSSRVDNIQFASDLNDWSQKNDVAQDIQSSIQSGDVYRVEADVSPEEVPLSTPPSPSLKTKF